MRIHYKTPVGARIIKVPKGQGFSALVAHLKAVATSHSPTQPTGRAAQAVQYITDNCGPNQKPLWLLIRSDEALSLKSISFPVVADAPGEKTESPGAEKDTAEIPVLTPAKKRQYLFIRDLEKLIRTLIAKKTFLARLPKDPKAGLFLVGYVTNLSEAETDNPVLSISLKFARVKRLPKDSAAKLVPAAMRLLRLNLSVLARRNAVTYSIRPATAEEKNPDYTITKVIDF